jgi:two-component system chemotaxis response regulator CheY
MTRPKALIVEDDEVQAKVLQVVLSRLGIEVYHVKTANEFIGKIKSLKPDFCLVDLNVESLGIGFSVIQAVRNVLGNDPVLVVASGENDRGAITHALEIGANDFIVKPIDRDILISKISRYVQTDKILDARAPLLPVPNEGIAANLCVDTKIQSVDEIGVTLQGSHLVAKGAAFHIGGGILDEITGRDRPNLMTVVSTWVNPDGTYGSYAEFDKTDTDVLTSVRRWIAQKKS